MMARVEIRTREKYGYSIKIDGKEMNSIVTEYEKISK